MTTSSPNIRRLRFAGLLVGGLAMTFAAASSASAQDAIRDRGDRYSRAQAENTSRARTRSDDNSRMERPRGDIVRSSNDGFRDNSGRGSFDSRFGQNHSDSRLDSRFDRGRFDSRLNSHRDSSSRITLGLRTSYSAPVYSHYDYAPGYRTVQYRAPYTSYRPAYGYNYYPRYYDVHPRYEPYYAYPAPRVIYSTAQYGHYSFGRSFRPAHGAGYGHQPRYSYPHSGVSFGLGIRYDYRH